MRNNYIVLYDMGDDTEDLDVSTAEEISSHDNFFQAEEAARCKVDERGEGTAFVVQVVGRTITEKNVSFETI